MLQDRLVSGQRIGSRLEICFRLADAIECDIVALQEHDIRHLNTRLFTYLQHNYNMMWY